MKKSITVLTSIILVFLFAVIAVTAQASDTPVTSNVSFTYELINNDTEYKITGCTSVSGYNIELVIPNEKDGKPITQINTGAFANRPDIVSVHIPDNIKEIGSRAFWKSGLKEVTIPSSVEILGNQLFQNCESLISAQINSSAIENCRSAFSNCIELKEVTLPQGIQTIPQNMFRECTSLKRVILPQSLQKIMDAAFLNCASLEFIYLPSGITRINSNAFSGCSSLKSIDIPENLSIIGSNIFAGCSSLKQIDFPRNMTSIPSGFLKNCTALTSVTLPEKVKEIGAAAFENCKNLDFIDIPISVNYIGNSAFKNCSNLKYIKLPYDVSTIDDFAFYKCDRLEYVQVGEVIRWNSAELRIGRAAFYKCNSLYRIEVHKNVSQIDDLAFYGCKNLENVYFNGTIKRIEDFVFSECSDLVYFNTRAYCIEYTGEAQGALIHESSNGDIVEYYSSQEGKEPSPIQNYRNNYTISISSIPYGMNTIVGVYRSGTNDTSNLSVKDKELYEAAIQAISESGITSASSKGNKLLKIYNWMVKNVVYATERYDSGTLKPADHTAEGALISRECVCSGYAEAFNLLMDMIGVDCITVSGYEPVANGGEGHAWNMVKANGTDNSNWAHIDATWGAGRSTKNKADYTYFMRSDRYMNTSHLNVYTNNKSPASYPSAGESANSKIETETDAIKYLAGYTGTHSHTYSETSTAVACTTAGYTRKQCAVTGCDYALYSNITAPAGHTLEKSATCTSGAICTKCNGEYGEPNLDNHYFCKGICVRCKLAIGDIDMDGVITPFDLTLQRRMISGQEPLAMTYIDAVTKGGYCYYLADLDRDGVLSAMDAANMPRLIVGNYTPPCDNADNCPYH